MEEYSSVDFSIHNCSALFVAGLFLLMNQNDYALLIRALWADLGCQTYIMIVLCCKKFLFRFEAFL